MLVSGEVIFSDDEEDEDIEINLLQIPLSNSEEKVRVILDTPVKSPAILGSLNSCDVTIRHDLGKNSLIGFKSMFLLLLKMSIITGEGVIEMMDEEVECASEDGEAVVFVKRSLGGAFPAEVDWITEDQTAAYEKHFDVNKGTIKFKAGELQRAIHIPVFNDPSGETKKFLVKLSAIRGRDVTGKDDVTTVFIENTPS